LTKPELNLSGAARYTAEVQNLEGAENSTYQVQEHPQHIPNFTQRRASQPYTRYVPEHDSIAMYQIIPRAI
jgi:hypothetical protein